MDFSIYALIDGHWSYQCNAPQSEVEAVCNSIPALTRSVPKPDPETFDATLDSSSRN